LAFCTFLCFRIDLATGSHFGSRELPGLFVAGGLVPAFLSCFAYAWLLYSRSGERLFARLRL
jgi:hypothetical protein